MTNVGTLNGADTQSMCCGSNLDKDETALIASALIFVPLVRSLIRPAKMESVDYWPLVNISYPDNWGHTYIGNRLMM